MARSSRRLTVMLVSAVSDSGRAATEAAAAHGVSWWLVQRALTIEAARLPDLVRLRPRILGIDEHTFRPIGFFKIPATKAWKYFELWMTTIVDLDTGQILGEVDGCDYEGVVECVSEGAADLVAVHSRLGRRLPPGPALQQHFH